MPDFGPPVYRGEIPIGVPVNVVSNRTHWVRVHFRWSGQSNHGPYPLPRHVRIQGGPHASGDRHVIVIDRQNCLDYELWNAYPHDGGAYWTAGAGAIFDLRSNSMRPAGWTSADAAGLSIFAGLVQFGEVAHNDLHHALRFTAPCTAERYVYPARHYSNSCPGRWLPPMGTRVRLRASVNIRHLPREARIIAEDLKLYGMILADNGGPWEVSGAPNRHWNEVALLTLERLKGRDFQVVDTASLPHPGL